MARVSGVCVHCTTASQPHRERQAYCIHRQYQFADLPVPGYTLIIANALNLLIIQLGGTSWWVPGGGGGYSNAVLRSYALHSYCTTPMYICTTLLHTALRQNYAKHSCMPLLIGWHTQPLMIGWRAQPTPPHSAHTKPRHAAPTRLLTQPHLTTHTQTDTHTQVCEPEAPPGPPAAPLPPLPSDTATRRTAVQRAPPPASTCSRASHPAARYSPLHAVGRVTLWPATAHYMRARPAAGVVAPTSSALPTSFM